MISVYIPIRILHYNCICINNIIVIVFLPCRICRERYSQNHSNSIVILSFIQWNTTEKENCANESFLVQLLKSHRFVFTIYKLAIEVLLIGPVVLFVSLYIAYNCTIFNFYLPLHWFRFKGLPTALSSTIFPVNALITTSRGTPDTLIVAIRLSLVSSS